MTTKAKMLQPSRLNANSSFRKTLKVS